MFDKYIGVDYSGAGEPRTVNRNIAVAVAEQNGETTVLPKRWSRENVYFYIRDELRKNNERVIVGIDHGFSYPMARLEELDIRSWDEFLTWFRRNWKTARSTVEYCRRQLTFPSSTVKRLVEKEFTPSAKSVIDLDRIESRQGAVSYSTHAGLAWICRLRRLQQAGKIRVHFWPFDGTVIPEDGHVIFEAYPSLLRRRVVPDASFNEHQRDAFAIASWLRDRDKADRLGRYLSLPTLTPNEHQISKLEGWILGCL